jgi:uncharacterized protein (TIGR00255 family)
MKPPSTANGILSMTGYAQARVEKDHWVLRVNLRSVNHRFLDLRVRMPEAFEAFEPRIRQLLRDALRRGHVEAAVYFEGTAGPAIQINREAASVYLRAVEELRRESGLAQEPDLVALLRLPGVVASSGASGSALDEEETERVNELLTACLQEALERLQEMRRTEGKSLAQDMLGVLAGITVKIGQLESLTERSRPAYARRLKARLADLLGEVAMDPSRLAQEAALLAERADVAEELARLRSHVQQFEKVVCGGGEIGKKLDFLLQEMQREANTFLSKTPGLGEEGLDMTDVGLQIKSEIERLREQAQNVE